MTQQQKISLPTRRHRLILFLGWEDPVEKEMTTQSCILGNTEKSHRQRSLAGYSPWVQEKSWT